MKVFRFLLLAVLTFWCTLGMAGEVGETTDPKTDADICFQVALADPDAPEAGVLIQKMRSVLGRVGCGCEDARYLIVPILEVKEVRKTSGMTRNVAAARGTLALEMVSAGNPEQIWHTMTISLKGLVKENLSPSESLANEINVSDSSFVRFIRVGKKKIAEATEKENKEMGL